MKVYVLCEQVGATFFTKGAVSKEEVANKFESLNPRISNMQGRYNFYYTLEVDSIELLDEIAKSEIKPNKST